MAKIESLKALADVMGFTVVPVSLFIAPPCVRLTVEEEEEEVEEEEEEEEERKWRFSRFQVSYLKHSNSSTVLLNGFDRSEHTPICCLATYFYVQPIYSRI